MEEGDGRVLKKLENVDCGQPVVAPLAEDGR